MLGRIAISAGAALLMNVFALPVSAQTDSACLTCHYGIEDPIHPPAAGAPATGQCVICHQNDNPYATTLPAAHEGMYPNPAAFDPSDPDGPLPVCKFCHADKYERVRKSFHSTSAGVITGTLWSNNAVNSLIAEYSNYPVQDNDGIVPSNCVASLSQIPEFSPDAEDSELDEKGHLVKDYLRKECLRCHVWTEGAKREGDYRSSGCAACHVIYHDDGKYRGGDPTIPSASPDHPMHHRITKKIPPSQCVHCHNRGARVGVSYLGMMESDGYGSPWNADGSKQSTLHGKHYNQLAADVHYQRGMACIDCHSGHDVMGDGNIYSNKQDAVGIECQDCHGTPDEVGDLTDSRGRPLSNVRRELDGVVILTGKVSGATHTVVQLALLGEDLPEAMANRTHMEKLECYSCHATWTPRCYGCHTKLDLRESQWDWIRGEQTPGKWSESRSFLRWDTPPLGINSDAEGNKVAPFVPGCQVLFTYLKADGSNRLHNKIYRTPNSATDHEIYSLMHVPVHPHTVQPTARTCDSCHDDEYALGLGRNNYNASDNGIPFPFDLQKYVDEDGRPIQGTELIGARPFNLEEMNRIRAVDGEGSVTEIPTPVPTPALPEDINQDGIVNSVDVIRLQSKWQIKAATE